MHGPKVFRNDPKMHVFKIINWTSTKLKASAKDTANKKTSHKLGEKTANHISNKSFNPGYIKNILNSTVKKQTIQIENRQEL